MEKLSWTTKEYPHKEKTPDWYWIVGIVTISAAIVAVILNNIIFAILIVVSSFTLSLFASKRPENVSIEIDNIGVTFGSIKYPYKNLDSFWVETREPQPKILLKSKKIFMTFIVISIENVDPELVRSILIKYLPEEEHAEPFLEKLLMYFGF